MKKDINLRKYAAKQLKELREKKMTQDELAEKLSKLEGKEIKRQTISLYENGERGMNQDVLFDLSKIFNVHISYFFPETIKNNQEYFFSFDHDGVYLKTRFSATLFELLKYNEIDYDEFSKKINISIKRLNEFLSQKEIPNEIETKKICDFFSIDNINDLFNGNIYFEIMQKRSNESIEYIKNIIGEEELINNSNISLINTISPFDLGYNTKQLEDVFKNEDTVYNILIKANLIEKGKRISNKQIEIIIDFLKNNEEYIKAKLNENNNKK